LIIDDDEDACKTLSDILQEKGYSTETARNGKETMFKVEKRFFDVALIDMRLPDMTGLDVLQVLGKISPCTMRVMITAFATLQNTIESVNMGINAFLTKPIDHEVLDKTIDECLKKQKKLLNFPNEVPASLKKPEIKLLLQKIRDGLTTEFIPSISNKKGVFYPEIEKIMPNQSQSEYYTVFEILERYGILQREFCDTVLLCPSCESIKMSSEFCCPSCKSTDISKQTGIFFKCLVCGKETPTPENKYICRDCKTSYAEDQLEIREIFTFVVSRTHELVINKWIDDLDNMLDSAREFYREVQPKHSE
jgi:CheY-like chemotaxis protein